MWWVIALIALIFSIVGAILGAYAYSTLDDLASDTMNSIEACNILNWTAPLDLVIQCGLTLITFFYPHCLIFNLILLTFDIYQYKNRGPLFGWDLYDPTKVLRKAEIQLMFKIIYVKLGFYILSVAVYFSLLIIELINGFYKK